MSSFNTAQATTEGANSTCRGRAQGGTFSADVSATRVASTVVDRLLLNGLRTPSLSLSLTCNSNKTRIAESYSDRHRNDRTVTPSVRTTPHDQVPLDVQRMFSNFFIRNAFTKQCQSSHARTYAAPVPS
mmetsp:Transcript_15588/g.48794  ORF Transcript_15588/g.48794 Transcript_15588/m.48794 type:complete len:129 (+) Transcript_15588:67-453(+)